MRLSVSYATAKMSIMKIESYNLRDHFGKIETGKAENRLE